LRTFKGNELLVTGSDRWHRHEEAHVFARNGATVIVTGPSLTRGAQHRRGDPGRGRHSRICRGDLGYSIRCAQWPHTPVPSDVLVNNAGGERAQFAPTFSRKSKALDLCLRRMSGAVFLHRALLPTDDRAWIGGHRERVTRYASVGLHPWDRRSRPQSRIGIAHPESWAAAFGHPRITRQTS